MNDGGNPLRFAAPQYHGALERNILSGQHPGPECVLNVVIDTATLSDSLTLPPQGGGYRVNEWQAMPFLTS